MADDGATVDHLLGRAAILVSVAAELLEEHRGDGALVVDTAAYLHGVVDRIEAERAAQ